MRASGSSLNRPAEAKSDGPPHRHASSYDPDGQLPLRGYLSTLGAYGAMVSGLSLLLRRKGITLPDAIAAPDVLLVGIATHKIARDLAKAPVTSPLRSPFTRYEGLQAPAELREDVRDDGELRHAIGELLTCPFCLAEWVATGLVAALVAAPRLTRMACAVFAAVSVSDVLQYAYAVAQREGTR